jgi:hypothetical protein
MTFRVPGTVGSSPLGSAARLARPFPRKPVSLFDHLRIVVCLSRLRTMRPSLHHRGEPMSANHSTLRGLVAAFNAHDLDRIMTFFTDDAVLETPRGLHPWGSR